MYIVVIPQDYHSAQVFGPFNSRKDGEDYIKDQGFVAEYDYKCEPYVTELTK